jgi:hypothetical protein
MQEFSTWTLNDRNDALVNHVPIVLVGPEATFGFQNLGSNCPGINQEIEFELPPPMFLPDEELGRLILALGDSPHERWMRTTLRVYRNGGRIWYRRIAAARFQARIEWPSGVVVSDSRSKIWDG